MRRSRLIFERSLIVDPVKKIEGPVQALDRADVDTDQIIPKQFLKRIERTGFGEFLFFDWRNEGLQVDPGRPILVTGRNFGCGSSREHAVWALQDFGFRAVIAPSFADIFYGNCTKTGLLPVPLPEADVRDLMKAERASIDLARQVVSFDGREVRFDISAETRERLLNGLDDIALTLQHETDIDRFEHERTPAGSLTTAI
jgi:3-isopropylmalate/(R)-2-methylmalate dehydratase small subunit